MRIRVEERHERIVRIVRERGTVRVLDLAAELEISVDTARRDVNALAAVGRLRRVHGSVSWPTAPLSARDARIRPQAATALPASGLVLGMVVPVSGYFYQDVIRGARAAAAAAGARLTVGITHYRGDQDARQFDTLVTAGVDGLLISPSWGINGPTEAECEQVLGLEVPAVLVERRMPAGTAGEMLDRVCSDHAAGAGLAVRHLAALGHRRIALLSQPTHTTVHLRRGYHAAMQALGLERDDLAVTEAGDAWFDEVEHRMRRLVGLAQAGAVRAAVVHTDADAINLLQHLNARGLSVPGDFAVVCYDDEMAAIADVPLSAIAPPKFFVGESAANVLLRRLTEPGERRTHIELLPELHTRSSCGAGKGAGTISTAG